MRPGDPFSARWAVPVRDGLVQPVVPVVTALLAGMLIGVTADPPSARSAVAGATVVLPMAAAPALPVAFAAAPLPLLPAPTPAGPSGPDAVSEEPAPAADPAPVVPAADPAPVAADPAPEEDEDPAPAPDPVRVPVKHVFLIHLADQPEDATYAPNSTAPYLSRTLTRSGVLLPNHQAVTRGGLPNVLAMLSGQGPTPQLQAGCPAFTTVAPASPGEDGQELGDGCVHTGAAGALTEQLTGLSKPWAGYVQSMGSPCRHPALEGPDDAPAPTAQSAYSTDRNPLVHFRGVIDDPAGCAEHVKDLDALTADLKRPAKRFPAFSLISPDRCHAGQDAVTPCATPSGLPAADAFLQTWVPRILASKAYADRGMIVITTDQAPDAGDAALGATGASGATGTTGATGPSGPSGTSGATGTTGPFSPAFPNVPAGQPAGGRVGMLVLSQDLRAPGSQLQDITTHFDLLRSLDDLLGLSPQGYAADPAVLGLPLDTILATTG